jgi:hypothetical protein
MERDDLLGGAPDHGHAGGLAASGGIAAVPGCGGHSDDRLGRGKCEYELVSA